MDTELISQKKFISSFISGYSDDVTMLESDITEKYKLIISRSSDNKQFTYVLRRRDDETDKYLVDNALSALGNVHTLDFLTDYLHELLEYSNFCVYNKDIEYESYANDNKDRKITDFTVIAKTDTSIVLSYNKYLSRSPEQMSGPTPLT